MTTSTSLSGTPASSPGSTAVTAASRPAVKPVVPREVRLVLTHGEQRIALAPVPLTHVRVQGEAVVGVDPDPNALQQALRQGIALLQTPSPTPARFELDRSGNLARIRRGLPGVVASLVETGAQARRQLASFATPLQPVVQTGSGVTAAGVVALPPFDLRAVVTTDEGIGGFEALRRERGFTEQLGTYTTRYTTADPNRCRNLEIAVGKCDGVVLQSGDEFSFNKVVGPRDRRHGFLAAGVISNGRVIPGLGGGICQVSTTLYNAVLLSALRVSERHHHSIFDGIPYAEKGLDAAVVFNAKDFRFKNNHRFPVLLSCEMGGGVLTARIFGREKPFDKVELRTKLVREFSPKVETRVNRKLKPGEEKEVRKGVTGYQVESYRIVVAKGKRDESRLATDNYLVFPRVVETGPQR